MLGYLFCTASRLGKATLDVPTTIVFLLPAEAAPATAPTAPAAAPAAPIPSATDTIAFDAPAAPLRARVQWVATTSSPAEDCPHAEVSAPCAPSGGRSARAGTGWLWANSSELCAHTPCAVGCRLRRALARDPTCGARVASPWTMLLPVSSCAGNSSRQNTTSIFGGGRWSRVSCRGTCTPRHTSPGRCLPTSARWSRSTTGPSLGHRRLLPTDRDFRVTLLGVSDHRATTEEQPFGVYDIGYYESPYETFFCYDYGAE